MENIRQTIIDLYAMKAPDERGYFEIQLLIARLKAYQCLEDQLRDIRQELSGINESINHK